jgi:hypothetical protein
MSIGDVTDVAAKVGETSSFHDLLVMEYRRQMAAGLISDDATGSRDAAICRVDAPIYSPNDNVNVAA